MWKHLIGVVFLLTVLFVSNLAFATNEMHWGFKKSTNAAPIDIEQNTKDLLSKYGAIYEGNTANKTIYLTFDNGYENGYTESILDTLKKEQAPATFFITGHYLTSATPLVERMLADGHTIGNHSYHHPNMAKLSEKELIEEWQTFDKKLNELTGIERTYFVRPPEGTYNEKVLKVGWDNQYRHIFWSIAFKDWDRNATYPASYAYNALMEQLHPGAIILMHTVAKHNAEALPMFIQEAKKQGYTFSSLDELIFNNETGF